MTSFQPPLDFEVGHEGVLAGEILVTGLELQDPTAVTPVGLVVGEQVIDDRVELVVVGEVGGGEGGGLLGHGRPPSLSSTARR
jgi:hypothetical protein